MMNLDHRQMADISYMETGAQHPPPSLSSSYSYNAAEKQMGGGDSTRVSWDAPATEIRTCKIKKHFHNRNAISDRN
jgi:hypothetical protein